MLTRILDWIDEAAGGMIRLAYLLAGITAVAVYFGAGHLPPAIEEPLNAALPWALAFAVEVHTYVTARRVRSAWQDIQAATKDQPEHTRARDALRVNLGILAALLLFSCWNQLNYLVETWTPPATAFALPGWVAYVVRALIVPAAFMCAAFLAPLAAPVAAQVEVEARATLAAVFRVARKQRRRMLKAAERSGRDMTGALVELVEDPAARRIISHAYGAIRPIPDAAENVKITNLPAASVVPDKPPTGPGSPAQAPTALPESSKGAHPKPLRLVDSPPKRRRATSAGRANTPAAKAGAKGVRTPRDSAEAERAARAAWQPSMSVGELQAAAGISRNAASKHRRILLAEADGGTRSQGADVAL